MPRLKNSQDFQAALLKIRNQRIKQLETLMYLARRENVPVCIIVSARDEKLEALEYLQSSHPALFGKVSVEIGGSSFGKGISIFFAELKST